MGDRAGLVGRKERDVALAAEQRMRELGAEGPSFPAIVAAGENGALPHAEAGEREIGAGELVMIDMGAIVDGYCSDCTRTFATGDIDVEAREVYELVLEASTAALEAVRAGWGQGLDAVARELIAAAGHGDEFGHGLGHGVGIEVHEAPRPGKTSEDELRRRRRRHRRAGRLRARPLRRADRGPGQRRGRRLPQPRQPPEGASGRRLTLTLRALLDGLIPLGGMLISRAMETATTPQDGASEHGSLNNLALSATFHCLIGCAIGEVVGMIIALSLGWSDIGQLALAVGLAYLFGFSLTAMPLVKAGLAAGVVVSTAPRRRHDLDHDHGADRQRLRVRPGSDGCGGRRSG